MSNKLSYVQARDKIWNAYFRDEIEPMKPEFCFCGTLSPDGGWRISRNYPYTDNQYIKMETALFDGMAVHISYNSRAFCDKKQDGYEDAVFEGMIRALEVLKQIHRERGEVIPEDEPLLTKRKLVPLKT